PALPLIFALMVYLAGLGAAGLIVLEDALGTAAELLATSLTLQVPAETSDARMQTGMALLRQTPGIASVRPLDRAEAARLLEPWLGPGAKLDILPVPRMIDLRLARDGAPDLAALQRQLAGVVPGAQLEDHLPAPVDRNEIADWRFWLVLAGLIIAAAAIAIASARLTVLRRLARMP